MRVCVFGDSTWQTTFPRLVIPLQDEWLFGLLLRCDQMNAWGSGTTQMLWLRSTKGRNETAMSNFIVGTSFHMNFLAQSLGLSERKLFTTTYYFELARLYNTMQSSFRQLMPDLQIRCCPMCILQRRLVRRAFMLHQITACPVHQIVLLSQCPCGRTLRPRTMLEEPFVCGGCGMRWGDFPQIPAQEEVLLFERKSLLLYDFFFSQGTPAYLERARYLILQRMREKKISLVRHYDQNATRGFYFDLGFEETKHHNDLEKTSLNYLVDMLIVLDISPNDIITAVDTGDKPD